MLNLSKIIKPWKEADALSAHINLYGFWTETAFLTKSGDLGMVLSVTGVDYESLDNDEQQYVSGARARVYARRLYRSCGGRSERRCAGGL